MLINTVNLTNGSRVFLIDQFFSTELITGLHSICDSFDKNNRSWTKVDWTDLRYTYTGSDPAYYLLEQEMKAPRELGAAVGKELRLSAISMWVDLPGTGTLAPHVEGDGSYLAQVYVTSKEYPDHGTTIYNDHKQTLFQLPYRDNLGWFFDTGRTVMHGRARSVPADLERYTIMLWFS